MLDKTLKVLNDILTDIAEEKLFFDSINDSIEVNFLKDTCKKLVNKVFSINSKLLLFEQLRIEFYKENNLVLQNYYVHESRNLLNQHNLKDYIKGRWQKELDSLDERDLNSAEGYSIDYSPIISKIKLYINKLNDVSTIQEIKNIQEEILFWYAQDIDMLAYSSFSITNLSFDNDHYIKDYSDTDDYNEKWINGEITLNLWRKFPNTSFLNYIEVLFSPNLIQDANKNQIRLYNEALELELNSLKQNIIESSNEIQKINIKRQIDLIERFTNGSFTDLDYQRLSNIIVFDRPDKIILAYDDIIRFDIYDYSKLLPYDGPNLRKSPRFVADLLILYKQFLNEQISILSNVSEIAPTNILTVKPTPKNFGFNRHTKKTLLFDVLQQLQLKYDLIESTENKIDDLVEVLTIHDYTTVPFKINIFCKTNLFTYILREIKFLFNNLNAKTIESSKLFYSNKGKTLLSATNFNKSANTLSLQKKEEIDKILIELKK